MKPLASLFSKDVLRHPLVLLSILAVALIALGSGVYYAVSTSLPSSQWSSAVVGSITQEVTGTGSVEPAQNPNLAFQNGGKVASVNVTVGAHVSQGQVLATLDQGTLAAQRAEAQANLEAQEAKLSQLQAGPRGVDVQAKQTAIDQANATLQNLYASIPANLAQAYDKSFSGVSVNTDSLFSQPNSISPSLDFQTTNNQTAVDAANERLQVNTDLARWKSESDALSSASSPTQIDAAITSSLAHLALLRTYNDTVLQALAQAVASSNLTSAQIAADQTAVSSFRDTINTQILALQTLQQQVRTDTLAVQSAQDALAQLNAGSTPQDIQAQQAQVAAANANIASINAQMENGIIIAPFSGTVTSVPVKSGQIVPANTVAVSLAPESALQVVVYLSELDVAALHVGDQAQVTLDAYGSLRVFPASIVSIDRSPTMQGNTPAYKTTLQFSSDDPAISSGMTANVTISAAHKDGALIIPKSAVIMSGSNAFVLISGSNGPVEKPVTLGLESSTTVEVTSGLSQGDKLLTPTR